MACKEHPNYKAKLPPRCECRVCWRIWYAKLMKTGQPTDFLTGRDLGDEAGS
jgi:hypothetical protein